MKAISIIQLTPREWSQYSEAAHKIAFAEVKPACWDRIDFALLAVDDENPLGYMTCREHAEGVLYWQYGGAFPGTLGTLFSWRCYQAFIEHCGKKYKQIHTQIENTNAVMLKMAMKAGFRVMGVRNFKNSILLEHWLEFNGG